MRLRTIALTFGIAAIMVAPAAARLWKPTPQQLAADYTTVTHNKSGGDGRVVVQWLAAPAFTGTIQQTMAKYVVISIAHTIQATGGVTEWEDVEGVQVMDAAGDALKEVPTDAIVPTLVSLIAGVEATQRQSTQGKSKVKFLVFEAGPVQACAKGGLVVVFEGEHYTFDTPIPGCTPQ